MPVGVCTQHPGTGALHGEGGGGPYAVVLAVSVVKLQRRREMRMAPHRERVLVTERVSAKITKTDNTNVGEGVDTQSFHTWLVGG